MLPTTLYWNRLDHSKCFHSGPFEDILVATTIDEDPEHAVEALMESCRHLWDDHYRRNFTPRISEDLLAIVKWCRRDCDFDPLGTWVCSQFNKRAAAAELDSDLSTFVKFDHNAVVNAWVCRYEGDAHKLLLRTLVKMSNEQASYRKVLPFCQSSGTGKSRAVNELRKLVFTLSFNFRRNDGAGSFSYPPPDTKVRDLFLEFHGSDRSIEYIRLLHRSFMFVLFREVQKVLDGPLVSQFEDNAALALAWYGYLEGTYFGGNGKKSQFYDMVAANTWNDYIARKSQIERNVKSTTWFTSAEAACQKAGSDAEAALDGLLETMQRRVKVRSLQNKRGIALVLAFDEIHTLTEKSHKELGGARRTMTSYHVLCDTIALFRKEPLVAVATSTNSNISRVAMPSDKQSSSERAMQERMLQPPFTECAFDLCYDSVPIFNYGQMNVDEVSTLGFMSKFGRPLFFTRYRAEDTLRDGLLCFARDKLLGTYDSAKINFKNNYAQIMAAFGSRVDLDVEPQTGEGLTLESTLVERHMRIIFSVPSHRWFMCSGYPSEPLLAEAASHVKPMNPQGPDTIADAISEIVGKGLASNGERGELVARVLLLQAANNAAERIHRISNPPSSYELPDVLPIVYSAPISVISFLTELFGEGFMDNLCASTPDNVKVNKTFKDYFQDAYIRLTHFSRAADDSAVRSYTMPAAMARAMSFECRMGQEMVDIVIPVVLRREAKLDENVMTAILIQIKKPADRTAPTKSNVINEKKLGFFPTAQASLESDEKIFGGLRPYISIVMELDFQPTMSQMTKATDEAEAFRQRKEKEENEKKDTERRKCDHSTAGLGETLEETESSKTPPPIKLKGPGIVEETSAQIKHMNGAALTMSDRLNDTNRNHPRFAIFVRGCSEKVYPLIGNRDTYAQLLGTRDLLREHPRQEQKYIDAVCMLNPCWAVGKAYHWTDNEELNSCPIELHSDESEIAKIVTGSDVHEPEDVLMSTENLVDPMSVDEDFNEPESPLSDEGGRSTWGR